MQDRKPAQPFRPRHLRTLVPKWLFVPARSSRTQHLRTWSHAWDLRDPCTTEERRSGGAGLFDVLPLPYQFILLTTQALPSFKYFVDTSASDPSCPPGTTLTFPLVAPLVSSVRTNCARRTWNLTPSATTSRNGTLMSSNQFTQSLAAMVAYVGSRGVHQPFRWTKPISSFPPRPLPAISGRKSMSTETD